MPSPEAKALAGIRVLDMTQFLAGPYCAMMLADMGAEVIKIENPPVGDFTRTARPQVNGVSMYFNNVNRNKKSISLDLKNPEDKDVFAALVKSADVLIENNRPGVMDRLGFGYEQCKIINPRLVFASISGFGQTGPYRYKPGYDIIAQALSGAMSITGWPGEPPTRSGIALGDILAGLNAAIGILGSLQYRNQTGKGQQVDVSLVDGLVSSMETISMLYIVDGKIPGRTGNRYLMAYPYDSFSAKDGEYVLACGTNPHFVALAQLMGRPELAQDPLYSEMEPRKANAKTLKAIIDGWGADKTVAECVEAIDKAGIPVGPIYDIKQVYEDEHIHKAREMFVKVKHPVAGEITITGNPIKLSDTPTTIRNAAPLLGEHTDELRKELGFGPTTKPANVA